MLEGEQGIDREQRTFSNLTPGEEKFFGMQRKLLTMFGQPAADQEVVKSIFFGDARIDSNKPVKVSVEPGRIDLLFSTLNRNLVRRMLRRTEVGSIDQKAIAELLESNGSTDLRIGLLLRRGGVVNGEIDSGNAGFVTNIPTEPFQSRVLPEGLYPLFEGIEPLEQVDSSRGIDQEIVNGTTTQLWTPREWQGYRDPIPATPDSPGYNEDKKRFYSSGRRPGRFQGSKG